MNVENVLPINEVRNVPIGFDNVPGGFRNVPVVGIDNEAVNFNRNVEYNNARFGLLNNNNNINNVPFGERNVFDVNNVNRNVVDIGNVQRNVVDIGNVNRNVAFRQASIYDQQYVNDANVQ